MQVLDQMMKEVDTQIRECVVLLQDAPEAKSRKHMLAFTRMLGLSSMLAYYLAHQPDALMPTQEIGECDADSLSISGCISICNDISSSMNGPVDTVRVNQIFDDVCEMMASVRRYIPTRILHVQPSEGKPIVVDDAFESNMADLIKNVETARKVQGLMCTESMPCTASMESPGILSQYYPGCGALGAPATPTSPAAKRSLAWGTPDVETDDVRDIEGNADGDTEDEAGNLVRCETRNLKRARTECE